MIVYVLMLVQSTPLRSETVHSVYTSQEAAEEAGRELEYSLPATFEMAIEPFEVTGEEDGYED